jgi:D-glycero-D-manno-heptose 1,7-bisphosphate phosphatase
MFRAEEEMSRQKLRPAVFLDRDGTLIQEKEYLADPQGVVLIPGAVEALRLLREAGFALVVVTNQSGIARGLYRLDQYRSVAARLDEILQDVGLALDATEFCPHHPDFGPPCECRKPGTGMHRAAARALGLDLSRSYFVGDRTKDVLPARELGGWGILVRTGYGAEEEEGLDSDFVVTDDVLGAALWILTREADLDPQAAPGGTRG